MTKSCPRCNKEADLSQTNIYRPFCSKKCKVIDLGSWANEEKLISRPIESEDFYQMTKKIVDLANIHSKGRIISFLEGGYDLLALSESIKQHLLALRS